MKINKFIGLGILVAMVFMFPLVTAATTLVAPAANTNHTGTIALLNCTTAITAALNMSWYSTIGAAVNYSEAAENTVANTSAEQTAFSEASFDISSFTDAATYNWSCQARNGTVIENSTALATITIDNTDPVVTLSVALDGESQSYGRGIEYSCTTTDAIDSGPTETFSVTHPTDDPTSSTSLTLQSANLFFDDTDFAGDYVFSCDSTDYTGNSPAASTATVTVDALGRAHVVKGSSGGVNWVLVGGGVVLLWFLFKKKKP